MPNLRLRSQASNFVKLRLVKRNDVAARVRFTVANAILFRTKYEVVEFELLSLGTASFLKFNGILCLASLALRCSRFASLANRFELILSQLFAERNDVDPAGRIVVSHRVEIGWACDLSGVAFLAASFCFGLRLSCVGL